MDDEYAEKCLELIQKLYQAKSINDDQRDLLKDMVFEEDAALLSFFANYSEPEDEQELKDAVIKYVNKGLSQNFPIEEQETTGDSLDDISSPMDSGIGMKKKRLAAMAAAQKKAKEQQEANNKPGGIMGISDCDIGASPQMSKGAIFSKKQNQGGGKSSPLAVAVQFKLGKKK